MFKASENNNESILILLKNFKIVLKENKYFLTFKEVEKKKCLFPF